MNLSSSGVLFAASESLEVGDPIEYVINLSPGGDDPATVDLHCLGKVMRADASQEGEFQVAATLERYEFVRGR